MTECGLLIVFLSGVGKGTVRREIFLKNFNILVTMTTRPQRPGGADGVGLFL